MNGYFPNWPADAIPHGTVVRMNFDDRGLAEIIDTEDGAYLIRYLPDPKRTTRYAQTGGTEWASPDDLTVLKETS